MPEPSVELGVRLNRGLVSSISGSRGDVETMASITGPLGVFTASRTFGVPGSGRVTNNVTGITRPRPFVPLSGSVTGPSGIYTVSKAPLFPATFQNNVTGNSGFVRPLLNLYT
jgi:hypothetical protein